VSVVLTRFLRGLLFGVEPVDALTYGVVGLVLLAISAGAALVPARRAARTDPAIVLRGE